MFLAYIDSAMLNRASRFTQIENWELPVAFGPSKINLQDFFKLKLFLPNLGFKVQNAHKLPFYKVNILTFLNKA